MGAPSTSRREWPVVTALASCDQSLLKLHAQAWADEMKATLRGEGQYDNKGVRRCVPLLTAQNW